MSGAANSRLACQARCASERRRKILACEALPRTHVAAKSHYRHATPSGNGLPRNPCAIISEARASIGHSPGRTTRSGLMRAETMTSVPGGAIMPFHLKKTITQVTSSPPSFRPVPATPNALPGRPRQRAPRTRARLPRAAPARRAPQWRALPEWLQHRDFRCATRPLLPPRGEYGYDVPVATCAAQWSAIACARDSGCQTVPHPRAIPACSPNPGNRAAHRRCAAHAQTGARNQTGTGSPDRTAQQPNRRRHTKRCNMRSRPTTKPCNTRSAPR